MKVEKVEPTLNEDKARVLESVGRLAEFDNLKNYAKINNMSMDAFMERVVKEPKVSYFPIKV